MRPPGELLAAEIAVWYQWNTPGPSLVPGEESQPPPRGSHGLLSCPQGATGWECRGGGQNWGLWGKRPPSLPPTPGWSSAGSACGVSEWAESPRILQKIHHWLWNQLQWFNRALHAQSCLTLCDPMDCSQPGSSVHGILQARILVWVAISFSRGSSQPTDRTHVSCISWH